ncbi:MAG TPA: DUF6155 family protein [Bacteroidia bacterium]|nr:DUF6155 family protein [Bacteroidia bacterium]
MKKLTKSALIKHLQKSEKEDIINEIIRLFDTFKNVKEFYKAELSQEENPVVETYKKKITKAYSSANPSERRTNLNVNKLITDFKKTNIYSDDLIEILLHRVEVGVEAISRNNKRSETFYKCIISSFKQAILLMDSEITQQKFEQRIAQIIKKSEKGKFAVSEQLADIAINYE